nr:MAG: ORF3 [Torque teno polar bear virus 3]
MDPPNLHKRGRAGQRGRAGHFRMGVAGRLLIGCPSIPNLHIGQPIRLTSPF